MDQTQLSDNIAKVRERVRVSAQKNGRDPADILLLAVSKTRPAEDIRQAHACGLTAFGENYLQEARQKIDALSGLNIDWHFIGPIQSNKTRDIARLFTWVHSVDRLKVAQRLSAQRPAHLPPLQICVQVNISGELSKAGVEPSQLPQLVAEIASLERVHLRGLMAIPAASDDPASQRLAFARLRSLLSGLQAGNSGLDTLSMGMSGDMEAAIAEGATIVRVGTAIFGPRNG